MTGIVGVNRDILGTGLGARPIANTDVFCFGPPNWEGDLPSNLFHPSRVLRASMPACVWAATNRASPRSTAPSCSTTATSASRWCTAARLV